MSAATCPLCNQRRAKRACPALGRAICAVCCATKREVEIHCPPTCAYLSSSRTHPAAVVRRRRERDYRFIVPLVADLTEQQYRLMLAFQAVTVKHAAVTLPAPNDADVREAAATVAGTLETSQKGIIYEHQAGSIPAQRLAREYHGMLDEIQKEGPVRGLERDAAVVLRRIERAAREATDAFPEEGGRAYLGLLKRIMQPGGGAERPDGGAPEDAGGGGLIITP